MVEGKSEKKKFERINGKGEGLYKYLDRKREKVMF